MASLPPLPPKDDRPLSHSAAFAPQQQLQSHPSDPFQPSQQSQQSHSAPPPTSRLPLPPPGWLPDLPADLLLDAPEPVLAALAHHPAHHPASCAALSAELLSRAASVSESAEAVSALQTEVRARREAVQAELVAVAMLHRQFRDATVQRDSAVERFRPRHLFEQFVKAVEEADEKVKTVESDLFDRDGTVQESELAETIKRLRDAKKAAFLRGQRRERWEEGRIGGWRY